MVLVLKKNSSKKEINILTKKLVSQTTKGFDAKKFNGVIGLKEDALEIQKKLRNEWERNID
jgi:hypothetical protein